MCILAGTNAKAARAHPLRLTCSQEPVLVFVANCRPSPCGKAPEGLEENSRGRKPPDRMLHERSPGKGE
jgi:hypothetical protein